MTNSGFRTWSMQLSPKHKLLIFLLLVIVLTMVLALLSVVGVLALAGAAVALGARLVYKVLALPGSLRRRKNAEIGYDPEKLKQLPRG